jgi:hypothetical protein
MRIQQHDDIYIEVIASEIEKANSKYQRFWKELRSVLPIDSIKYETMTLKSYVKKEHESKVLDLIDQFGFDQMVAF